MIRVLLLVVLAAAPLLAAAHGGHHLPSREEAWPAPEPILAVERGAIVASVAAPTRCPGSGHDLCCCHDATATSSFQPAAIDAPCALLATLSFNHAPAFDRAPDAPRAFALARHSPRGPPARS